MGDLAFLPTGHESIEPKNKTGIIGECGTRIQTTLRRFIIARRQPTAVIPKTPHSRDQHLRAAISRQTPQAPDVIGTKYSWHDNLRLPGSREFGVHHQPRDPSVAIGKRMHLAGDEQNEHGTRKRMTYRAPGHLPSIRRNGICAENVVTIRISCRHHHSRLDNPPRLFKLELRTFDIIREIAFEERKGLIVGIRHVALWNLGENQASKMFKRCAEKFNTSTVIRVADSSSSSEA